MLPNSVLTLLQFQFFLPRLRTLFFFEATLMTQLKGMQRNSIVLDYHSCTTSALFSTIIFHKLYTMFPYSKQSQHLSSEDLRKALELPIQATSTEREDCLCSLVRNSESIHGICRVGRFPTHPSGQVSLVRTGARVTLLAAWISLQTITMLLLP